MVMKYINLLYSDYIIDLGEPIGLSSYVTECLKNDTVPELKVIDAPDFERNPSIPIKLTSSLPITAHRRRSSSLNNMLEVKTIQNLTRVETKKKDSSTLIENLQTRATLFTQKTVVKRNEGSAIRCRNTNIRESGEDRKTIVKNSTLINNNNFPAFLKSSTPLGSSPTLIKISTINESIISKPSREMENSKLKNIFSIATFNPDLVRFSEMKGIRKRKVSEEVKEREREITTTVNSFDLNKIMQKSIEKKLKIDNEKRISREVKPIADVDHMVGEKSRSRSKGISSDNFF
jgi:hypothetical protein